MINLSKNREDTVTMNKNKTKSLVIENKADKLKEKSKDDKAFELYKEALNLNPERLELYDKIIKLHEKFIDNWDEEDFSYNLSLTMAKQEIENPLYKRVHARLTDEYRDVQKLIKKMLDAKTSETQTKYIELIKEKDADAIYPLIDYLLGFIEFGKSGKAKKTKKNNAPTK
jgi:hypothetical protein